MRRVGRWVLPVGVFALLATPAVVTSQIFEHIVHDQEQRLLVEHADEGASFLSSSVGPLLGELTLADRLVQGGTPPSEAVKLAGTELPVTWTSDLGTLDPGRRALAERSRATGAIATGMDGHALVLAFATPTSVYTTEFPSDPTVPVKTDIFRDLDGMVYASGHADASQLIFVAGHTPLTGKIIERKVKVADDTWLVRMGSHVHLVGDLAYRMPWIILAAGLIGAACFDALIVVLLRRRAWAERIVDERTVELRAARESAEVANRAKSEFLSRMSHELRTPLNAVLGFAQLLELDELSPEQRDNVEQITRGGRHLLHLINEVLEITRIETGDLALSPEPVAADDVVGEVVALTVPLAADVGITITHDPSPGIYVLADRQRLKQVLLNLVSNAVKYNRVGGSVVIRSTGTGGNRRIEVRDTGVGIAPENFDRLFTPFDRLGADARGIEGTGIGLSLSRRLTEAMGGSLGVASTPGEGSTFSVSLPMAENPSDAFERTAPVTPAPPAHERHTVLYIEDNPSNVHLVERLLERMGAIDLVVAMHGRLGLDLATRHRPALVLLDLHLPDMAGEAVLHELRNDSRTADIPVVVLSADATPGAIDRLRAAGATDYLTKPIDVSALMAVLDEHVVSLA